MFTKSDLVRPKSRRTPKVKADHLTDAVTEVRAELVRADSKAAMLLALSGAAAALAASGPLIAVDGLPGVLTRAGMAALVSAVVVLLLTVRPRLTGAPFMVISAPGWRPETPAERMTALSAIARAKFLRIRMAVDLLVGGVALLGIGTVWAVA